MATLLVTTAGTLGDHLPYIALAQGLQRRGHRVRLAVNSAIHPWVKAAGLEALECGLPMDETLARRAAADWDEWQPHPDPWPRRLAQAEAYLSREIPLCHQQLLAASADADLLICGLQRHLQGALLAQRRGLPWIASSVMPAAHCAEQGSQLGGRYLLFSRLGPAVEGIVAGLGLRLPREGAGPAEAGDAPQGPALLAASPHFATPNAANAHYRPCGFWFHDQEGWRPDPALERFLARWPRPLVLSFSSQPLLDPGAVLALHLGAAARLGRGLLVQRGWADFTAERLPHGHDPDAVLFTDFIPQGWLFQRAGAVIHHGGIGTIARALRHGCPMLVEPYGNDQFFNAKRVVALGVGAAANPSKLTPDGLARLLEGKVLTPDRAQRAAALGERLAAEDGVGTACDWIEEGLGARC
jgi:UDP:flavonoid glycosyltransferase YjiC (YdhE family)